MCVVHQPFGQSLARLLLALALVLLHMVSAHAQMPSGDPATGRMLYRDTPLHRGSVQACAQCHPNAATQQRGQSLVEQYDHIRCAIQGGCGGAQMAVYPYGAMAQFQGLLDSQDLLHLAAYIRSPQVSAPLLRATPSKASLTTLIGAEAGTASLSLSNLGEQAARFERAEVIGPSGFGVNPACAEGGSIGPGQACGFALSYVSRCTTANTATLVLHHSGPLSPLRLALAGQASGLAQPEPSFSAPILSVRAVDGQGFGQVSLSNLCGGQLRIYQVALDPRLRLDPGGGPDACVGNVLELGQSCVLKVSQATPVTAFEQTQLLVSHSGSNQAAGLPVRLWMAGNAPTQPQPQIPAPSPSASLASDSTGGGSADWQTLLALLLLCAWAWWATGFGNSRK